MAPLGAPKPETPKLTCTCEPETVTSPQEHTAFCGQHNKSTQECLIFHFQSFISRSCVHACVPEWALETLYCIADTHAVYIILTSFPIDSPLGAYPRPCVAGASSCWTFLCWARASATTTGASGFTWARTTASTHIAASALECLRPRPWVLRAPILALTTTTRSHIFILYICAIRKKFGARKTSATVGRRPAPSPVLSIRILSRN